MAWVAGVRAAGGGIHHAAHRGTRFPEALVGPPTQCERTERAASAQKEGKHHAGVRTRTPQEPAAAAGKPDDRTSAASQVQRASPQPVDVGEGAKSLTIRPKNAVRNTPAELDVCGAR